MTASWSKGKDINREHLALVKRKRGVYLLLSFVVLSCLKFKKIISDLGRVKEERKGSMV